MHTEKAAVKSEEQQHRDAPIERLKSEAKEKAPCPDLVKAIKHHVAEELAYQIVNAIELEARRRAGNLHIGCIVFDAPYGEFRKLSPAPEQPSNPPAQQTQEPTHEDPDRPAS